MHPNGQVPAYEWAFGDVNPPVHAWAAYGFIGLIISAAGAPGIFSKAIFKSSAEFYLVGQPQGSEGRNIFAGGFLGLDNIGVFDR